MTPVDYKKKIRKKSIFFTSFTTQILHFSSVVPNIYQKIKNFLL